MGDVGEVRGRSTLGCQGRDREHDEPHVADAGVGDQPLEVGLRQTGQRRRRRSRPRRGRRATAPPRSRRRARSSTRTAAGRRFRASAARRPAAPNRSSGPCCARRAARSAAATSAPWHRSRSSASTAISTCMPWLMSPRRAMISTRSKEPVSLCSKRKATSISADPDHRHDEEAGRGTAPADRVVLVSPVGDHEPHRDQHDLEEHEEHDQVERRRRCRSTRPRSAGSAPAAHARPPTFGARRNIAITQHQVSTPVSTTSGALKRVDTKTPADVERLDPGLVGLAARSRRRPSRTVYPDTDRHQAGSTVVAANAITVSWCRGSGRTAMTSAARAGTAISRSRTLMTAPARR